MNSYLDPVAKQFSSYLTKHSFKPMPDPAPNRIPGVETACYSSDAFLLKLIATNRRDIWVEATTSSLGEDWYDVQTVLEMLAGTPINPLATASIAEFVSQMEAAHGQLSSFFSTEGLAIRSNYALWQEGSFWGQIEKSKNEEEIKVKRQWWRFW